MTRFRHLLLPLLLLTGCSSTAVLPSSQTETITPWKNFEEAKAAFDKIVPGHSTATEIHALGFDPYRNANIQILNYVDIIRRFMPNDAMRKEDLAPAVRECIEARESCRAYEAKVSNIHRQRYGNVALDLFNFRRRTHESGWHFEALLVLNNGRVVYTLYSGRPLIDNYEEKKNPLGPLQSIEGALGDLLLP